MNSCILPLCLNLAAVKASLHNEKTYRVFTGVVDKEGTGVCPVFSTQMIWSLSFPIANSQHGVQNSTLV